MKGLELSKRYFEEFGRPMLENEFSHILPFLCIGFVGSGSERYGFDDEISKDHDFEPGFCIFLPQEDIVDRRNAFLLERAYSKLPKEYMGYKRQPLSPVGGNRNGVIRTADFYTSAVGSENGDLSVNQWLTVSDETLAEAVNGEIFIDNYGEFTAIRQNIENMPTDIRLKRLAGHLLTMGTAGQYNFPRCIAHGEIEAAALSLSKFVDSALRVSFLLSGKYMPYYKWSFKALRNIEKNGGLAKELSFLVLSDHRNEDIAKQKKTAIERISQITAGMLKERGFTKAEGNDLGRHAYSANDLIKDNYIRNLHILATV